MCGICGIHVKPSHRGKVPVGKMLDALLLGIEERGREATGFISVSFDNEIQLDKAAVTAKDFIKKRKSLRGHTQTVLGHTRLATQGSVHENQNNHPVQFKTVFTTHNGVIWNDKELFEQYGMDRPAEVDSIVIPAMIHEHGFTTQTMEKIDGAMAIASIDVEKPGLVMLAKGYSSPLAYIETDQFIVWASTVSAIREMWGKTFGTPPSFDKFDLCKDGDMITLENGVITLMDGFEPAIYGGYTYSSGYTYSGSTGTWPKSKSTYKPSLPTISEINNAESYADWAEIDNELHRNTIEELGFELTLSPSVVEWLLNNSNEKHITDVTSLRKVLTYIKSRYQDIYDALMAAGVGDDGTRQCLVCSDPTDRIDSYCGPCAEYNRGLKDDDYKPGDNLKKALLAVSNTESLEEFVQERQVERRQVIAELTTGSEDKPKKITATKKRSRKKAKA